MSNEQNPTAEEIKTKLTETREQERERYDLHYEISSTFADESKWQDMTEDFTKFYTSFPDGEFKGDEFLNLAKVLHSIEVFNPYMDVGHLLENNYTSEELYKAGKIQDWKTFTNDDLVELLDCLFVITQLYFHGKLWNHTMQCCDYINLFEELEKKEKENEEKEKKSVGYYIVKLIIKICNVYHNMIVATGCEEEEFDYNAHYTVKMIFVVTEQLKKEIEELLSSNDSNISNEVKERISFFYQFFLLKFGIWEIL